MSYLFILPIPTKRLTVSLLSNIRGQEYPLIVAKLLFSVPFFADLIVLGGVF